MKDTYIKLSRCLQYNAVFDNPELLKVWIWCLMKASHTERSQLVGAQKISLQKGDFVFGRLVASRELNMTESKVYRLIKRLELHDRITIKANNKYSVVNVINWGIYQGRYGENEQQNEQVTEQQLNNNGTTTEQQLNTNNNVKTVKKVKNVNKEDERFNIFYGSYPNKTAKLEALKSWNKINLTDELFELIMSKLELYKKTESWEKDNGKYIPLPSTWINQKRWEDEIKQQQQSIRVGFKRDEGWIE